MNPWYDRLRCWLGIHEGEIVVEGQDSRERLDFTVRLRCRRCRVASEGSIHLDKGAVQCCQPAYAGGLLCTKVVGHAGQHGHPAYGEWTTVLMTAEEARKIVEQEKAQTPPFFFLMDTPQASAGAAWPRAGRDAK